MYSFQNSSGNVCTVYSYRHPVRVRLYVGSQKYNELFEKYISRNKRYGDLTDAQRQIFHKNLAWSVQEKYTIHDSIDK